MGEGTNHGNGFFSCFVLVWGLCGFYLIVLRRYFLCVIMWDLI